MPEHIRRLTLANGLPVTLRHVPTLKRAAAALQVHAGSHDAPSRWPGLAHLLEHLFFLGTSRFGANDGLMRYVQALGGQVNASTRERSTAFFFEVPPAALDGGLLRLCDMLAEPDLSVTRQRAEREVIHAEFIAWSRDRRAQQQFAQLQRVSARHPLAAFHAGNRFSLAVANPAFQQALAAFHREHYCAPGMTLSLCGPQPLAELETLARTHGERFASGSRSVQVPPPSLLQPGESVALPAQFDGTTLHLAFAHQQLPDGAEAALHALFALLGDRRPGTWLGELHARDALLDYRACCLYSHAGQLLWSLELDVPAGTCVASIEADLYRFLGYLGQAEPQALNAAFAPLQRRRARTASALTLAQQDSTGLPFQSLNEEGLRALTALLDDLPKKQGGAWALPPDDPWLRDELPELPDSTLPAELTRLPAYAADDDSTSFYLRWQLSPAALNACWPGLQATFKPLQARAERAALRLTLNRAGPALTLACSGPAAAVLEAMSASLLQLRRTDPDPSPAARPAAAPLMPIRALLEALPDALHGGDTGNATCTAPGLWTQAGWHGLAVGFPASAQGALAQVIRHCPGLPQPTQPYEIPPGRHWHRIGEPSHEHALLVFCAIPAAEEAVGRVLAQALQGPVYQRLRVELQLGYAVFSGFRYVEGVMGLLIGIQSPCTPAAMLLAHIQALLEQPLCVLPQQIHDLAKSFLPETLDPRAYGDWAWQTQLATHPSNLSHLRESILKTGQAEVDDLRQRIARFQTPWSCLSNGAQPATRCAD